MVLLLMVQLRGLRLRWQRKVTEIEIGALRIGTDEVMFLGIEKGQRL